MAEGKEEEFELIPVSPLRKLEKRIERLEAKTEFTGKELYKEMIEIIRMNQQIVDELVKANDALRIELSKLPLKLDELIKNLNELISFIKASAEEEAKPTTDLKPLTDKLDKLIKINTKLVEDNENLIATLEDLSKKLKRPVLPPPPPIRKPLLPRKPI